MGDWDWGLGVWVLGIGPNPQSPIPNPQSPIPMLLYIFIILFLHLKNINNNLTKNFTFIKNNIKLKMKFYIMKNYYFENFGSSHHYIQFDIHNYYYN